MKKSKAHEVLELLRDNHEMFGLELVNASDGKLKRGTIYVTLSRMEDNGWLKSQVEEPDGQPGMPRRLYSLTNAGKRELELLDYVIMARTGLIGDPV